MHGVYIYTRAVFMCLKRKQEGDLMRTLNSKVKDLPADVTSAVVVESAAQFRDPVTRLLHPQSAMNHLLSHGTRPCSLLC